MESCVLTAADLEYFEELYPEELLKDLPADELLVGCVEEAPSPAAAGILMAHVQEGEALVDWLYVDEPFRRRGGGRAMLQMLTRAAEESGELDGVSLTFSQNDAHMSEFLRACDFMVAVREGSKGFSTRLKDFPQFPVPGEVKGTIVPLADVSESERARFAGLVDDSVLPNVAVQTPFDDSAYRPESCACVEDGVIRAVFLVQGDENGLSIPWMYNGCSAAASFIAVVNESISRLKGAFSGEVQLAFASIDSDIDELIERRIPIEERAEISFGTYRFGLPEDEGRN